MTLDRYIHPTARLENYMRRTLPWDAAPNEQKQAFRAYIGNQFPELLKRHGMRPETMGLRHLRNLEKTEIDLKKAFDLWEDFLEQQKRLSDRDSVVERVKQGAPDIENARLGLLRQWWRAGERDRVVQAIESHPEWGISLSDIYSA